jgi:hypothetical protein
VDGETWIKTIIGLLAIVGSVFGGLRWAIRTEVKPSMMGFTASVNALTATLSRVDTTLQRVVDQSNEHARDIAVLKDRQRRS